MLPRRPRRASQAPKPTSWPQLRTFPTQPSPQGLVAAAGLADAPSAPAESRSGRVVAESRRLLAMFCAFRGPLVGSVVSHGVNPTRRSGIRAAGRARPRIRPAGCGAGRRRRPTASAAAGGPSAARLVRDGLAGRRGAPGIGADARRWFMPTGFRCYAGRMASIDDLARDEIDVLLLPFDDGAPARRTLRGRGPKANRRELDRERRRKADGITMRVAVPGLL